MARRHAGNFRAKHPDGATVEDAIAKAVTKQMAREEITCKSAFSIAAALSVAPKGVGVAIDLQNGRLTQCQLGLFGYGHNKSILDTPSNIDPSLQTAITDALEDGRLTCQNAWQIAVASNVPRLEVARTCESLGIRISHCQLGAF